jgi:hypothetical protein
MNKVLLPGIDTKWNDGRRRGPPATENALVDPKSGVSKIWFTATEKGRTKTYDQDGVGFVVQDTLLLGNSSCIGLANNALFPRLKVAVRVHQAAGGSIDQD